MTFLFLILAAIFASFANCAMRKTLNVGGSDKGYLTFYFLLSFFAGFFFNSLHTFQFNFSPLMATLGGLTGLFVVALMFSIGMALKRGPSGLTFAFQNSGAIFPPLFFALVFKQSHGFTLTLGEIIGMILVMGGLFWSAYKKVDKSLSKNWLLFAILTFLCQSIILCIFQWRCLLFTSPLLPHVLIPFHCSDLDEKWFMPAMFLVAWFIQLGIFFFSEKRLPNSFEAIGGSIGGAANGLATCFLLYATKLATSEEKSMLFPLFAVFVILLCNLYGRRYYQETVNWLANGCCVAGILIGTFW